VGAQSLRASLRWPGCRKWWSVIDAPYYKPHTNPRGRASLRWLFVASVGLLISLVVLAFAGQQARAQSLGSTLGGGTEPVGAPADPGSLASGSGGSGGGSANPAPQSASQPAAGRGTATTSPAGRSVETGGQALRLGEPERRLAEPTAQQTQRTVEHATEPTSVPMQPIRQVADPVGRTVEGVGQTSKPLAEPVARAAEPARETLRPVADQAARTVEPVFEPVRETVEPVRRTVTPVIEPVRRTTKPLLEPVRESVEPPTEAVQQAIEPVADPRRTPLNPAVGPRGGLTSAPVPDEGIVRWDGSPSPRIANSLATRSTIASLAPSPAVSDASSSSPKPGLVSVSRAALEGPTQLLIAEEGISVTYDDLLAPHSSLLLGRELIGGHPTILSRDATAGNTAGPVSPPSSSVPASGGAPGSSGPGLGVGLAILSLLSILLLRGKLSWSSLEFLRPNSALRLAKERPG
jgi:hypothetical protein